MLLETLSRARSGVTRIKDGTAGRVVTALLQSRVEAVDTDATVIRERWVRTRPRRPPAVGSSWGVYRWTRINTGLLLEHARQGAGHPVPLVELIPSGLGLWASRSPHLCGEDAYSARVCAALDGRVTLEWTVSGPRKDMRIQTRYRARVR